MVNFVLRFTPEELEQLPAWRKAINTPPLDMFVFAVAAIVLVISLVSLF